MLKGLLGIFPCLKTQAQKETDRESRYVYPLDSESNTWARSDGVVMNTFTSGKTKRSMNESEEQIFGMEDSKDGGGAEERV